MSVNILGVKIDDLSGKEVMALILKRLQAGKQTFIATPNPEILVLAQKDRGFKEILNHAEINIPDGTGLAIGAKITKQLLKNRVTGTDLMEKICGLAEAKNFSVYLLGARTDVAREAVANIKKKYPDLKIAGAESGGKLPARRDFWCHKAEAERRFSGGSRGGEEWDDRVIIEHINAVRPDILFVALGHGKQEKWIFENFKKLESVKLAMGVGGAFDFFAGLVPRAPKWMRNLGLEWLWRLFYEPARYKRIWNAVIVFPWLCFIHKRNTPLR